jgi:tetratricopeptide (TPR) repeat protein
VGVAFLLSACSTKLPAAGVDAYYKCDYPKAIEVFKKKTKKKSKDYVLFNLAVLSAAMGAGDYAVAERASLNAQRVMWSDAGKGRGRASLVTSEAVKVFKGEPFEKSMAALYAGIIFFNREDYDNARAAFSKALLSIKQKEKVKHREDFALANLLLAKTFLKLGETDNARIALKRAKARYPNNPVFDLERLRKEKALFVVELGKAPKKVRKGPGASLTDWKRKKYRERSASIRMDGMNLGHVSLAGDLTHQAKTKGWTGKDSVQVTKGVARDAAVGTAVVAGTMAARGNRTAGWVALGAGLFALANQSQADIRQWSLLPDGVFVHSAKMGPGKHTFELDFYDSRKRPLSNYKQIWHYDHPPKGKDRIFLFRSGKCPKTGTFKFDQNNT